MRRSMATSSSDGSCTAPIDFHLSSSLDDCCSRLSGNLEKCPLCSNSRKTFYCKQCVQNGDFVHSTPYLAERFAEKQLRLFRLKKERLKVQEQCEGKLCTKLAADQLRCEIDACQERIRLLRLLTQETRDNISRGHAKIVSLKELSRERSVKLPCYQDRVRKLEKYVHQKQQEVIRQHQTVEKKQQELKQLIRYNVQQLKQYIFPISEVYPSRSEEDHEVEDTVSALADATRTAYIQGQWVYTDNSGELQYQIVAPTLPSSGDYSAYNVWVATNKDGVPGGTSETVDHNPAYSISAALTYTTQLVNMLAYYLDVPLPKKLGYSDFCGHEMSNQQFARRVAKLNSNILHLCFSQNVNPELLTPTHTLRNLLLLLNTEVSDLGRQGPLEINCDLAKSLEDQLLPDLESREDSDDSRSEEENDTLPGEWEAVPHLPYLESAPGPMVSRHNLSSTVVPRGNQTSTAGTTTSMAGGLMTSAAASLASFWRGWTGQK